MEKRIYITDPNNIETVYCSAEEQETVVNILRNDSALQIYTCDSTMITKLKKLLTANPDGWTCWEAGRNEGKVTGYFFEAPKSFISFKSKKRVRKPMTDEQKAKVAERLKKGKANK